MIFLFSPLLLVRLLFARIISDIFLLHSAAVSLSPMALGSSITVWRTVRRCQQINFSCRGTFFFFFVFGIFGEKGKERRLKILHVFSSLWHSFQFFMNLFIAINARIHEWNKRSPKKCLSRSLKMRRGWRCEWRDALACVGVGDEIYRRFFELGIPGELLARMGAFVLSWHLEEVHLRVMQNSARNPEPVPRQRTERMHQHL